MNRLQLALLLFVSGTTVSCHSLKDHPDAPNDADTDAEGTSDDSGKVDARPADAGDAADAADAADQG